MQRINASLLLALLLAVTAHAKTAIDTKRYAHVCVKNGFRSPIEERDGRGHAILKTAIEASTLSSILSAESPQHKAMCYMIYDDPKKPDPRSNKKRFLDRYALITFYTNTKGPGWLRSDNWLSKEDECMWYGVTCTRNAIGSRRVTGIDLSFNKITGIIPREMGYLTELTVLDLNGNSLQGVVPPFMLSNMKKLQKLHLHMNDLFGNIPREIGSLKNLTELTLFGNFFFGKVPPQIGDLKKLEILDIYANNLTGRIPSEIGKMNRLKEFYVNDNEFQGAVPAEICKRKLTNLAADCLGYQPEVRCDCCTVCCQGLPDPKCRDMKAGAKSAQKKKRK